MNSVMKIGYCLSNLMIGGVQINIINIINNIKKKHHVKYCVLSNDATDPLIIQMLNDVELVTPKEILEWSDIIHLDGMELKTQKKIFKHKWSKTIQFAGSNRKVNIFNKHLYSPNLVATSKKVGKTLKQKHIVIYPSVNTEIFKPLNIKKQYDLVFLGRLRPVKNLELFLEICKKGNFSFLVIGGTHRRDGGRMNMLEQQARSQASHGRGHVTGFIAHDKIPNFLNLAKIAVVTSHSEGFGLNCLESMSCGVPVITRDVGGVSEAVGFKDLLISYNYSAEEYVKKINNYINNIDIVSKSRNRVVQNFSNNKMISEYLILYTTIHNKKTLNNLLFWR